MKKFLELISLFAIGLSLAGCMHDNTDVQIAATTAPVYEFTTRLCHGTDIRVGQVIAENISCLHDYTLQTSQMRMIENAELIVISGAGLEDFFLDVIDAQDTVIDASTSVQLICNETEHEHAHTEHAHMQDSHIWLAPKNAAQMATNICNGLQNMYPQYTSLFKENLQVLLSEFSALQEYGTKELSELRSRKLITFHDGFAYLAEAYNLEILYAIEEESGSEAPASELIKICQAIRSNNIPAVFTEQYGSTSASSIISLETGVGIYQLDMAMSGNGYFTSMYNNINAIKEALE